MKQSFIFIPLIFGLIVCMSPALGAGDFYRVDAISQRNTASDSPPPVPLLQTTAITQQASSPDIQEPSSQILKTPSQNAPQAGEPDAEPSSSAQDTSLVDNEEYGQLITLARQGSYSEALAGLSRLVAENPENQKILADYITVLLWADKTSEVAEASVGLTMHSAPEYALNAVSLALRQSGELNRAKQWLKEGIKRFPDNEDFSIRLAIILAEEKEFEQAEELLQGKDSPTAHQAMEHLKTLKRLADEEAYDAIIQEARQGDIASALAQLQNKYRLAPENSRIGADYLTVLTWDNRMHEAAVVAHSLNPSEIPDYALAAGGEAFRKTGKLQDARQWYEIGINRFPENQNIQLGLALVLAESGQPDRGLALVERLSVPAEEGRQLHEIKRYIRRMIKAPSPIQVPPREEKPYRHQQDEAVALARSGQLAQGLQELKALHQTDPTDQYLLSDYMVVLQWARRNQELVQLSSKIQPLAFPAYGVAAVAAAKMELRDYNGAMQFVEKMLQAQHRNPDLLLVAAEIYQGAGLYRQSVKLLDEVIAQRVPGMGRAIEATKRKTGYAIVKSMDDLEHSNDILQVSGAHQDGMKLHTHGLSGVGGPHEAQKYFNSQLNLLPQDRQNIATAAENKKSFWAERINLSADLEKRNQLILDSLATLNAHKQKESYYPALADMNRIYPLYMLNENAEAVAIYENLQGQGVAMHPTALLAAGGAYLNLQQPLKAQQIFLALLTPQASQDLQNTESPQKPLSAEDRYVAMQGLFWAYLESEQLSKARQQAYANLDFCTNPPSDVGRIPSDDWKRSDALNTVGLAELYTGYHDIGEQHFKALLDKAPANTQARAGLAEVFAMKNLPRAAYEQTRIARIYEPDNLYFAIDEAQRLIAMRRWEEAEKLIGELAEYAPYSKAAERLVRKWETHTMHELHIWSSWSDTRNSNPNSVANRNVPAFEWRLYSKPLLHNWRFFMGSLWDGGDFEEGTAHRTMVLGGIDYRSPGFQGSLQVNQDHVRNRRTGLALEGEFQLDDHWRVPFTVEKNSRHIPLRARYNKIYADSASIGVGYFWDENREINMAVGYMDFSDDNKRVSLQADFRQRLDNWYTHYLDLTVEAYSSHNSEDDDRPYFNPKQDYEVMAGFVYGDVLWRDYDNSLSHAVGVKGGVYDQKHYDSGAVWNVNYSQTLDLLDRFSANYGASYGKAYYDGDSENELNLFLNMTWKF